MSISENVGGMSKYLNNIRTADKYLDMKEGIYNSLMESRLGEPIVSSIRRAKSSVKQLVIPGMFFEDMGITYLGPVDGHNINAMIKVFREAKRCKSAVLVHVITQKGICPGREASGEISRGRTFRCRDRAAAFTQDQV